MCGMVGVINMGFDSFRFMENVLFSGAIDMNCAFPYHHRAFGILQLDGKVTSCGLHSYSFPP